jgi:hypothetical protein
MGSRRPKNCGHSEPSLICLVELVRLVDHDVPIQSVPTGNPSFSFDTTRARQALCWIREGFVRERPPMLIEATKLVLGKVGRESSSGRLGNDRAKRENP